MDKQSYYTMIHSGKLRIRSMMFEYEEAKWIFEKWCEGYSTHELAKALNCSATTIKRAIKPFKNKNPLVVPKWVTEHQRARQIGEEEHESKRLSESGEED